MQLEFLPVPCQYMYLLEKFIISYQENFEINLSICNINLLAPGLFFFNFSTPCI